MVAAESGPSTGRTPNSEKGAPFQGPKNFNPPPSAHHQEVDLPSKNILRHAQAPPNPTLPRRPHGKYDGPVAAPFAAALSGGAGKRGEVIGRTGGRYVGEMLAGRPHGVGEYWVPPGLPNEGGELRLQYSGEWFQGRKEGMGAFYYRNGELYKGHFLANERSGQGRMEYRCGDAYDGTWRAGQRHGAGTLFLANGDVFVGQWASDKMEGLGAMYCRAKGLVREGEWVLGQLKTGTVRAAAPGEIDAAAAGQPPPPPLAPPIKGAPPPPLPQLDLANPDRVVFAEVVPVRRERAARPTADSGAGTLPGPQLERLRHAFIAMAGGDAPDAGLRKDQLHGLLVLAGLDPASTEAPLLAQELADCCERDGMLRFDDFAAVCVQFSG